MSDYPFQNIILKELSDGSGWQIIGVRHNLAQDILFTFGVDTSYIKETALVDQFITTLANGCAIKLTGKLFARLELGSI